MFDRNLAARAGSEIVIGILFQERFRSSLEIKTEMEEEFGKVGLDSLIGLPVRLQAWNLEEVAALDSLREVDVLYITPLRAVNVEQVTAFSRKYHILTFTGVPDYMAPSSGASVGVELKGGRPQIVINLSAAKAEGADFSSQLLKLARVVGE